MDNRKYYPVRNANREEWDDAMALAWRTFMHFEASDYPKRGQESFLDFISDPHLHRMFIIGEYKLFVALDEKMNDKVIGMITVRNKNHISLLFVDEHYHYHGIGRKLIYQVRDYIKTELKLDSVTVNSSPYAVEFYHRLGFKDEGGVQENDGVYSTPMRLYI